MKTANKELIMTIYRPESPFRDGFSRLKAPALAAEYLQREPSAPGDFSQYRHQCDDFKTEQWFAKKLSTGRDRGGPASQNTVSGYQIILRHFRQWRLRYDLALEDIKRSHWDEYAQFCASTGNTEGGLRSKLQKLNTFFNYLADDEDGEPYIKKNPFKKVKKPRLTQAAHEKFVYSPEAFTRLMQSTDLNHWIGKRDRAIFCMARFSGARRSELANIKIADLHLSSDESWFTIREGKGGKSRIAYIEQTAYPFILEYMQVRSRWALKGKNHEYLWVNRSGEPATIHTFKALAKRYKLKAALDEMHSGPHSNIDFWHAFRKTFAQDLAMLPDSNRFAMMEQFGWTTGAMVERYAAGLSAREMQRGFANVYSNNGGA